MRVLAKTDSFVNDRFVPAGFIVEVSDDLQISGNFEKVEGAGQPVDVIQMSAIAPTGPNPTAPQQIAPDHIQSVEGYVKPGARIVGEVTLPAEQRIEIVGLDSNTGTEAEADEALVKVRANGGQNGDDALVAGTVKELESTIATADEDELDRLEAAEQDREKPRLGVQSAIDKRREELQE